MTTVNREAVLAIIESRRDKLNPTSRIDIVTNLVLGELRDAVLALPDSPAPATVEDIPTTRVTLLGNVLVTDENAVAQLMIKYTITELRSTLLARPPLDRKPRYRSRVNSLNKRDLAVILTSLKD